MASLRERFERFVKELDGFEDIDVLLKGRDLSGTKRADYLFAQRNIIVEQKVLEVDPHQKPQAFIDQLIKQGRILFLGGKVSTDVIFGKMPDGEELKKKLILKLTKVLDDDVAKADKQTRDTRDIFSIPNALGILVILNENARILSPDLIYYGLSNVFRKVTENGSLRYPHNNGVVLISEAHVADVSPVKVFPIMTFISPHGRGAAEFGNFSGMLMKRWAEFNGVPLILAPPGTKFPTGFRAV
jgi:hypothetical protein